MTKFYFFLKLLRKALHLRDNSAGNVYANVSIALRKLLSMLVITVITYTGRLNHWLDM